MTATAAAKTELLRACRAGDKDAFGQIVRQYQGVICALTYSGTGDVAVSEDLAQETFIRAWQALRQLRDFDKFGPWLCKIARNLVRKSLKKNHQDVADAAQSLDALHLEVPATQPGPLQACINKEQQALVWSALQRIPDTYREPIVLFYRQNQSVSQVAAALSLSEDAARQRLSRGRKLLKAELACLLEDFLNATAPNKAFTAAVVAALPPLAGQTVGAAIAAAVAKAAPAAKAAGFFSILGAILGPLLGMVGAIIGIRAGIAAARSPRERAFMKKTAWLTMTYVLACFGLLFTLRRLFPPTPGAFWLPLAAWFLVFFAGVLTLVITTERRRRQIQVQDDTYVKSERHVPKTKGQIYGSFGGAIFGSLLWLHLMAVQAHDWPTLWAVLAAGVSIFLVATRICLRARQRYNQVAAGAFAAVGILYLAIVNLRWHLWMQALGPHSKYRWVSLWQINILIVGTIAVLLLILLLTTLGQRPANKQQKESRHAK